MYRVRQNGLSYFKGNKKRTKQVTEKSFIFSKIAYNLVFSALGFENNITQVAIVICDALLKPFSKVFHYYVGHLWGNGGNFLTNSLLKCLEGLRPMFLNLVLEVSPQGKNRRGSNRASARTTRYRLVRR